MLIPRIWTYWHQGWENAPSIVERCLDSWIRLNPDYEVCALDRITLLERAGFPAGIDPARSDLTVQKLSALGRLALLSQYGGVWADATVMCTRPLSDWLPEYLEGEFFAFRSPGPDRMISNWFIAAESHSVILRRLYRAFSQYYADNRFSNQGTRLGNLLLDHFGRRWNRDPESSTRWHSWFSRRVLRVYPYFIFHYTFNKLILEDPECAEIWNSVPAFSAQEPHRVQFLERAENGIAAAKLAIDSPGIPMHKLNWRVEVGSEFWAAVLPYFSDSR